MRDAIIWKESIYKNNFKCNKCGKKLMKDFRLIKSAVDVIGNEVYCQNCTNHVAKIIPNSMPDDSNPMQGKWKGESE